MSLLSLNCMRRAHEYSRGYAKDVPVSGLEKIYNFQYISLVLWISAGEARRAAAVFVVYSRAIISGCNMVSLVLLLKGLGIGLAIAAPVGPIAFLCIRTTLRQGRWHGFAIGAGAAVADSFYGAVGVMGIAFVMDLITGYTAYVQAAGGIFLLLLGARMMLADTAPAALEGPVSQSKEISKSFITSFFLTITNPLTIFAFMAIFAGLGMSGKHSGLFAGTVISGVFVGSLLWWLILSSAVHKLRSKVNQENLHRINLLAGALVAGFGVFALLSVLGLLVL